MPPINLALSSYRRTGFPTATTVNCLSEAAPTLPGKPEALIARPGLSLVTTLADGPIRGVHQKAGLFDNAALIVADTSVYTLTANGAVSTISGAAITGPDLVEIDSALDPDYRSIARIATGDALYKINSTEAVTEVVQENFPNGENAGASSICFHKGYWLGQENGTDAFYYQNPAETAWNALQFASAEYQPDPGVAIRSVGDVVALQNSNTMEIWRATGDSGSPFEPYGGLTFDHGCRSRASSVNCQGALIYVDNNCSVRMFAGGDSDVISDNGLAEIIDGVAAADLQASFYIKHQHPLYVLNLVGTGTWAFDLSTRRWTQMKSGGSAFWRPHLFCAVGDETFAADRLTNKIWKLRPDLQTDEGDTFTMEWTAMADLDQPTPLANVVLHCEVGGAPRSGQGSEPLVWMEASRDGGKTWGQRRFRSLGATGRYDTKVRFNALGLFRPENGIVLRFGCSDPVIRRISSVVANAP